MWIKDTDMTYIFVRFGCSMALYSRIIVRCPNESLSPYRRYIVTLYEMFRVKTSQMVYNCPVAQNDSRKEVGRLGEDIACQFLVSRGFKVLDRNYRKPWGEIDIIAEYQGVVRFVEVKAVSRESLPDISREMDNRPEELVDVRKLRKLARTAVLYMEVMKDHREFQIDVVGVVMDTKKRIARCRFFEQALEDNL